MQESNSIANANKFTPQPGDKIICNNGAQVTAQVTAQDYL